MTSSPPDRAPTLLLDTPPLLSAPQRARDLAVAAVLAWDLPVPVDELCLLAGELTANAVVHAATRLTIGIQARADAVRIEVTDRDSRLPLLSAPHLAQESHRGLMLVAALATRWGVESRDDGKVVWAEVDFPA
ncbi:hypothetical protein Acor_79450 [Acrocarpospora corrugata]|uniref:Histidine kinase/HSP90-like ATPase domain-containing protein n=1 Tax=Acrocarpospora corrugata TaxID=35763 RepID=A0A5M3WAP9_9ACTN|nr:ATP-binding protein [Acrocarpospora corrugata]GES05876.1 hypothetical protein Acor_79450 [Acrocarpospora corrugata]